MNRRSFLLTGAAATLVVQSGQAIAASRAPIVRTRQGQIAGAASGPVQTFKGIPYAAAPVGSLRFAPPAPAAKWKGTRPATELGNPAIQMYVASGGTTELSKALEQVFPTAAEAAAGREDCLYLNVWTPKADRKARPVMVWFHGGGFAYGSGGWPMYDGASLAAKGDVVVVTVNHRLNVFGYLDLSEIDPSLPASGNTGMLDLVASLQWVRDNIAAFGGDPGNVTIFGESGGGAKVSYLMAMPSAKGLFHRAIVQSGPGVRAQSPASTRKLAADLMSELGLGNKDLAALRAVPAADLLKASLKAQARQPSDGFERTGFSPVVDGAVLPHQPWDPAAPDVSKSVPLMIGINKDEMTLFMASAPWFGRLDDAGLQMMAKATLGARADAVLAAVRESFPGYSPSYLATALTTYGRMFAGSVQIAERKAAQGGAPAFAYLLEWETSVGGGLFKSPHTLEIPLVFNNADNSRAFVGPGDAPVRVAAQMSDAWLAFARTGNPNAASFPAWPAYDASARSTLIFNLTSRVEADPYGNIRKALFPAT